MVFCSQCKTPKFDDHRACPHCDKPKGSLTSSTAKALMLVGLGLSGCDGLTKSVAIYGAPITQDPTDTSDTGVGPTTDPAGDTATAREELP